MKEMTLIDSLKFENNDELTAKTNQVLTDFIESYEKATSHKVEALWLTGYLDRIGDRSSREYEIVKPAAIVSEWVKTFGVEVSSDFSLEVSNNTLVFEGNYFHTEPVQGIPYSIEQEIALLTDKQMSAFHKYFDKVYMPNVGGAAYYPDFIRDIYHGTKVTKDFIDKYTNL